MTSQPRPVSYRCEDAIDGIEGNPAGNPYKLIAVSAAQIEWLEALPLTENQTHDHASDLVAAWDSAADNQAQQIGAVLAADRATGHSSLTYLSRAVLRALGYPHTEQA